MTRFRLNPGLCFALFQALLPAILAAALFASPSHLAAQQSAPAAAASNSSQVNVPSAELSEKEEDNVYRHTPLVEWIGKFFHVDVETAARSFEIVNFLIIVLAIVIPLGKFLPKYLRGRREKLSAALEEARKMAEDARARMDAVEAKLSKIDEEIAKFRSEVERDSEADEARIKASLKEESERIFHAAEQEIDSAAAQARRVLRSFAADLAIDQAARQLRLTAETDRELIAEFVGDVGRGGAGGKS